MVCATLMDRRQAGALNSALSTAPSYLPSDRRVYVCDVFTKENEREGLTLLLVLPAPAQHPLPSSTFSGFGKKLLAHC